MSLFYIPTRMKNTKIYLNRKKIYVLFNYLFWQCHLLAPIRSNSGPRKSLDNCTAYNRPRMYNMQVYYMICNKYIHMYK